MQARRNSEQPLAEHAAHSHWVWQARFNPAHDSLLLTSSSDALVDLWFLPSLGMHLAVGACASFEYKYPGVRYSSYAPVRPYSAHPVYSQGWQRPTAVRAVVECAALSSLTSLPCRSEGDKWQISGAPVRRKARICGRLSCAEILGS